MATQTYIYTLEIMECTCGVTYGLTEAFIASHRESHKTFWCPNGCSRHYPQKNEKERLRAELAAAEGAATAARADRDRARRRAEHEKRRASALRGHLTRIKNRIANGVCPVPGCKRSGFANSKMHQHLQTVHPEWHAEHAHDLA